MNQIPFMNLKDCYTEIYSEVMDKIADLIDKTQFVGGEEIELFEKEFAAYCHTTFAVGCSNGTDAIEIALKVLGVSIGDKVLVPVNTFIATAEAVINVGADVVFIDVDEFHTIDPKKIVEYLEFDNSHKVKAIIPVHLYGQMANMPEIMKIAKKYNLKVIEDSAQAHGADFLGRRPGEFGDMATFSFYPGKNLGAFGDAGAVIMNDERLYENAKMLVNHGRRPNSKYEHELSGSNKRMDTIQAAILRIKLKFIDKWTKMRRDKAQYYFELLNRIPEIKLPVIRESSNPVWHLFVIRIKERDVIQNKLQNHGIATGIHYPIPLHMQAAYRNLDYTLGSFPVAENQAKEILSLPFWPEISNEEQKRIVECLEKTIIEIV